MVRRIRHLRGPRSRRILCHRTIQYNWKVRKDRGHTTLNILKHTQSNGQHQHSEGSSKEETQTPRRDYGKIYRRAIFNTSFRREVGLFPAREAIPGRGPRGNKEKWNALIRKLTSIRFLESYSALRCVDRGNVAQFEHTVWMSESGAEVLTVE